MSRNDATLTEVDRAADEALSALCRLDPFLTSAIGIPDSAGLVPDVTEEGVEQLRSEMRSLEGRLNVLDAAGGDGVGLTVRMARWHADLIGDIVETRRERWTCTAYKSWSLPTAIWSVMPKTVLATETHAQLLLERVRQLPTALRATQEALDIGTQTGTPPVARLVEDVVDQMARVQREGLSTLLGPVWGGAVEEAQPYREEVSSLMDGPVAEAFGDLTAHLAHEIGPRSRADGKPGLCWIEGGSASYETSVREHTTTDQTAEEIHETGKDLVASLREELADEGGRQFGATSFEAAVDRLRNDPAMRFTDSAELMDHARAAFEHGAAVAPELVGFDPATRVELRPMPELESLRMMQAYYRPGDATTDTPGVFWLNMLPDRAPTRYELQTLVAHESCPGHHIQWSRARETPLHRYRSLAPTTAFIEGWALYVERRCPEWGLFTEDLATMGMLSSQLWRACRLVVDTGIHAYGWSRNKAVAYLLRNSAIPVGNAEAEIDRYIGNPGQALAYSTGLLAVEEARARAELALGPRFREANFHQALLGHGSPPLFLIPDIVGLHIRQASTTQYGERS